MNQNTMQAIYQMAIKVYNKNLRLSDAKRCIYRDFNVNENSFADNYRALNKMLDGKLHKRGINSDLRDYFLSNIHTDFGVSKLKTALCSFMESIEYYEKSHNTNCHKDRKTHDKYYKLISETNCIPSLQNGENDDEDDFYEGEQEQIIITKYERNIKARQKCIETKGVKCAVCGFDFETIYGDLGKGFIHVHHINPIALKGEKYTIDYEKDLEPVCPNCHAMLHRKGIKSIEELKLIMSKTNKGGNTCSK